MSRHPDRQKVLYRNKAIKKGQPGKNSKDRKGQLGREIQKKGCQDRATGTGSDSQAKTDNQDEAARKGKPGQDRQEMTARAARKANCHRIVFTGTLILVLKLPFLQYEPLKQLFDSNFTWARWMLKKTVSGLCL